MSQEEASSSAQTQPASQEDSAADQPITDSSSSVPLSSGYSTDGTRGSSVQASLNQEDEVLVQYPADQDMVIVSSETVVYSSLDDGAANAGPGEVERAGTQSSDRHPPAEQEDVPDGQAATKMTKSKSSQSKQQNAQPDEETSAVTGVVQSNKSAEKNESKTVDIEVLGDFTLDADEESKVDEFTAATSNVESAGSLSKAQESGEGVSSSAEQSATTSSAVEQANPQETGQDTSMEAAPEILPAEGEKESVAVVEELLSVEQPSEVPVAAAALEEEEEKKSPAVVEKETSQAVKPEEELMDQEAVEQEAVGEGDQDPPNVVGESAKSLVIERENSMVVETVNEESVSTSDPATTVPPSADTHEQVSSSPPPEERAATTDSNNDAVPDDVPPSMDDTLSKPPAESMEVTTAGVEPESKEAATEAVLGTSSSKRKKKTPRKIVNDDPSEDISEVSNKSPASSKKNTPAAKKPRGRPRKSKQPEEPSESNDPDTTEGQDKETPTAKATGKKSPAARKKASAEKKPAKPKGRPRKSDAKTTTSLADNLEHLTEELEKIANEEGQPAVTSTPNPATADQSDEMEQKRLPPKQRARRKITSAATSTANEGQEPTPGGAVAPGEKQQTTTAGEEDSENPLPLDWSVEHDDTNKLTTKGENEAELDEDSAVGTSASFTGTPDLSLDSGKVYHVRTPWEIAEKRMLVAEARQWGIRSTARRHNMSFSTLRVWMKQDFGDVSGTRKRLSGGGRPLRYDPAIDEELKDWVLKRLALEENVTHSDLRKKAMELILPQNPKFIASMGWIYRFLYRHQINLKTKEIGKNAYSPPKKPQFSTPVPKIKASPESSTPPSVLGKRKASSLPSSLQKRKLVKFNDAGNPADLSIFDFDS